MGRDFQRVERGIHMVAKDTLVGVHFLFGSGAPGGDAGEQDAAEIGSLYQRTSNGALYKKTVDNNAAADWVEVGDINLDDLKWRNEIWRAATNDTLIAGATDPSGWSDNDSGIDFSDFTIGDYVLGDQDGTPAAWEVTAIADPNITLAAGDALADGDKFVVRIFLPDSGADQEGAAFLLYASGSIIKVADFDWEIAKGIFVSAGYTAANGNPAPGDSVETVLQYLDGNQDDIQTTSGVSQGATHNGTFTGNLFADSLTTKAVMQRIEDLLDELKGVQATGITTEATVDSVPVATAKAVKWLVHVFEEATPANSEAFEIFAMNDGSTGVDDTIYSKLKQGSAFNLTMSVDIDTGNMRLRAASTSAGVTVTARRIEVVKDTI